jgi:hypothetical protein
MSLNGIHPIILIAIIITILSYNINNVFGAVWWERNYGRVSPMNLIQVNVINYLIIILVNLILIFLASSKIWKNLLRFIIYIFTII